MGFLDKLLNSAAKKAISEAIDSVTGSNSNTNNTSVPQSAPAPIPQESSYEDNRTLEQKLDAIFPAEFPSNQMHKEVSPATMGATDAHLMPYSYVLSQNGQIRLIVMRCDRNTCSTRAYRFSKEFAQRNNITLINFLEQSPNEESYVIDRLHQYL